VAGGLRPCRTEREWAFRRSEASRQCGANQGSVAQQGISAPPLPDAVCSGGEAVRSRMNAEAELPQIHFSFLRF